MENIPHNLGKGIQKEEKKDSKEIPENLKPEEEKEIKEEEINEGELIEFLKNREPGDPEAVEHLKKWIDQEQKKVGPTPQDQLNFNICWARIYKKAGWAQAAREAYEDVIMQAYQQDAIIRIQGDDIDIVQMPNEGLEDFLKKESIENLYRMLDKAEEIVQIEGVEKNEVREKLKAYLEGIYDTLIVLNRRNKQDGEFWRNQLIWNPEGYLTEEEFDQLNLRRKQLSNAIGIMTVSGTIRHDLNEI